MRKMIKKYSLLAIISLIPLLSFSQLNWQLIEVPDTIQIMSIASNNQNHIFLGTGGNGIKGGIYKSIDNCNNWIFLGFENSFISFIEMNILNHIYIGTNFGIFWSDDNGDSWDTLLYYTSYNGITSFKSYGQNLFFAGSSGNSTVLIRSIDQGETWEEVLTLPVNIEYFYDIVVLNEDTVFACTTNWIDGGGVYKSTDGGYNWDFAGMYDFHCFSLEKNSMGDIFVGTYGHNTQYWLSGVYVLYHGTSEWIQLYTTLVNDMVVKKNDHLFVATDFGVLRSMDNGQTFEYINDGLFNGHVDDLAIDSSGYLYASSYSSCHMARSTESTITGYNYSYSNTNSVAICNYPNPFHDFTTIEFDLSEPSQKVSLVVLDSKGNSVKTLIDGEIFPIGKHQVNWFVDTASGVKVKEGIYFYKLTCNNKMLVKKAIVIK